MNKHLIGLILFTGCFDICFTLVRAPSFKSGTSQNKKKRSEDKHRNVEMIA